ncbi:MAG TPA: hypothetical protein PLE25_02175 [Spirochaetales bacterium]|nr:hypothetical protein [Spirochaetales bacterium]
MKAFITLLRQELVVMARNGMPLVLAIVLAASAGSVHAVRAVDDANQRAVARVGQQVGQQVGSAAGIAGSESFEAGGWTVTVVERGPESNAAEPDQSLADSLVLALLVFEVLVLGFLFVAVGLFQELGEGSLRAYRLSPGGQLRWMAARYALWVGASLAYATAFLASSFVWPGWQSLAGLLAVTALGSLVMTALGLTIAVFSGGMSGWFIPAVGILMVNMAPMGLADGYPVAYWLTPGGAALAGYRSLFGMGRPGMTGASILWLGTAAVVALPLSWWAVRTRVFKEGRR